MPGYAQFSSVLSPATSKAAPWVVQWTEEMLQAFHDIKGLLSSVTDLIIPTSDDQFIMYTDASSRGVGAALFVTRKGKELPVSFFSRQLVNAQKNYSATELEGLAIMLAVQYYSPFLYGTKFIIRTDHRALVSLLKSRVLNNRLYRWVLKLQSYDFVVEYHPGKENVVADALSRQFWNSEEEVYLESDVRQGRGVAGAAEVGCKLIDRGCGAPTPLVEDREKEEEER